MYLNMRKFIRMYGNNKEIHTALMFVTLRVTLLLFRSATWKLDQVFADDLSLSVTTSLLSSARFGGIMPTISMT